jgi:hypothetical protein
MADHLAETMTRGQGWLAALGLSMLLWLAIIICIWIWLA